MNWRLVFQELAFAEYTLEEVAKRHDLSVEELVRQVKAQSTGGPNMEAAKNAARKLAQIEERAASEALVKGTREAAERAAREKAKQEAERRALVEAGKRAAGEKAKQQALVEGAKVSRAGAAGRAGRWLGGRGAIRVFGLLGTAVGVALALLTVWEVVQFIRSHTGGASGTPTPCPEPVLERHKCPWSPDGYAVEPCGPGYCYDAGPQGSLACKQEQDVPHSYRNDLSNLICEDGYLPERDPCTGVILECVRQ